MKLTLATLIQLVARREAVASQPAAVQLRADPFERLDRIVRVERAREAVVLRALAHHHAG